MSKTQQVTRDTAIIERAKPAKPVGEGEFELTRSLGNGGFYVVPAPTQE